MLILFYLEQKKMAKKTIKMVTFINNNRKQITEKILELHEDLVGFVKRMSDDERRVMILNEPELTAWAISEGVQIS